MAKRSIETLMSINTAEEIEWISDRTITHVNKILEDLKQAYVDYTRTKLVFEQLKKEYADLMGDSSCRNEEMAVIATPTSGKKTLDKVLLIENGVTIDQIEASYKTGKGYTSYSVVPVVPIPELEDVTEEI